MRMLSGRSISWDMRSGIIMKTSALVLPEAGDSWPVAGGFWKIIPGMGLTKLQQQKLTMVWYGATEAEHRTEKNYKISW